MSLFSHRDTRQVEVVPYVSWYCSDAAGEKSKQRGSRVRVIRCIVDAGGLIDRPGLELDHSRPETDDDFTVYDSLRCFQNAFRVVARPTLFQRFTAAFLLIVDTFLERPKAMTWFFQLLLRSFLSLSLSLSLLSQQCRKINSKTQNQCKQTDSQVYGLRR